MQRIRLNLASNAFSQAFGVVQQITTLPIMLYFWTPQEVGVWLMLATIPMYLALADFGLVATATNQLAVLHDRKDERQFLKVWSSLLLGLTLAGLLISAAAGVGFIVLLVLHPDLTSGLKFAYASLALLALVNIASGLIESMYRTVGQAATGTAHSTVARLFEWLASLLVLSQIGSFSSVATAMLVAKISYLLFAVSKLNGHLQIFRTSFTAVDLQTLRKVVSDGVGFFKFSLANAIQLQSLTLIVGAVLGPASVTAYNATRTLTRLPVQISTLINRSFWPQLTMYFGKDLKREFHDLLSKAIRLCTVFALLSFLMLAMLGNTFLTAWLSEKVNVDEYFLYAMAAAGAVCCVSQCYFVGLASTNNHQRFANIYLSIAIFSIAGSAVALKAINESLLSIASVTVAAEILILAFSYRCTRMLATP